MFNQLNYYSRYNRIKNEDQKMIPSLYSLLSRRMLTKLANDATLSLQIINLCDRKRTHQHKTNQNQNEEQDGEYLQANINKIYLPQFDSQNDKLNASPIQIIEMKSLQKSINRRQIVPKQKLNQRTYLQGIVREIREKSRQRVGESQGFVKQEKKIRKNKSIVNTSRSKKQTSKPNNKIIKHQTQINTNFQQSPDPKKTQRKAQNNTKRQKPLQNTVIKSLLSQHERQKHGQKKKLNKQPKNQVVGQERRQMHSHRLSSDGQKQEYVQSVQDDNQNQDYSHRSVVIGRLNLEKDSLDVKGLIGQCMNKQRLESQSKVDNASSNEGRLSQIKSYQKQQPRVHKPAKNLIELELNHSQSEIWDPQQRSLDTPLDRPQDPTINQHQPPKQQPQQKQLEEVIHQIPFMLKIESSESQILQISNPLTNRTFSKPDEAKEELKDNVDEKVQQIEESYPMTKSYKTINNIAPAQFLSQMYIRKVSEQPPYEHPLEVISEDQKHQMQSQNATIQANKKTSFKKFMMNKQLNPRLVTSTILNQKNSNHRASRQNLKDSLRDCTKQDCTKQDQQSPFKQILKDKSSKKTNFRQMMNKKPKAQNFPVKNKIQEGDQQKKLQNQKLLLGFFNDN